MEQLDLNVIGQETAKKQLSAVAFQHTERFGKPAGPQPCRASPEYIASWTHWLRENLYNQALGGNTWCPGGVL